MKIILSLACLAYVGCVSAGTLQAGAYQDCFTPGQNCTGMIVDAINGAQKSIDVQAYGFTSQPIVNALLKAEGRGVKVRVILDKSNLSGNNSEIPVLQTNNIPVWIDYKVKIAHNKVMVIDSDKVITGSFNFTTSAQYRNAENVIILSSSDIASSYEQNFQNRLAVSLTYQDCFSNQKCSRNKLWDGD